MTIFQLRHGMSSTNNGGEESQYIDCGDDVGISMNEFIKKKLT